ncbi:hypothetical protein [Paenibacillus oryzisoli]|uniref:Uncharacterized protein n=1 Tax=Paenibacillus oryzisoli TaxID=1850517 RepID=A0A197ZX10_9BACL|nr:hypothetical protein [Paenibacillus oryzisoli]OAS13699.1 hypothetical protein A8708_24970 [Paenibacillus oryzisoli]
MLESDGGVWLPFSVGSGKMTDDEGGNTNGLLKSSVISDELESIGTDFIPMGNGSMEASQLTNNVLKQTAIKIITLLLVMGW